MILSDKQYALICYQILTRGDHAPSYYIEKIRMLDEGLNAFAYLDMFNMGYLLGYCEKWGVEVPEIWKKEVELQYAAARELQDKGIDVFNQEEK